MAEKPKQRILNVDDEDAGRYVVTKILTRAGYDVIEAATGRDALRLAGQRPDLILLDVNLPDIHGFDVCNRIKADPRTASIPVVHLSATHVRSANRVVGLEGGADGYLVEPIDPQELVATVRAFLRLKDAEQALRESEEKYRLFLQNFAGIAYQADLLTFKPTFFHGTVEQISGYTAADFVTGGMTWDRIIHPEDLARVRAEGEKLFTVPGYIADNEYRIVHKNGDVRWVRDLGRRVVSAPGSPDLMQGAIYDVTDRVQVEEGLIARTQQLEAVRAVSEEITRELSLSRLFSIIHRRAAWVLDATLGTIFLWDEEAQLLIPNAWSGYGDWMGQIRVRLGERLAGIVAQRREGIVVNDYRASPMAHPAVLEHTGVTAAMAEPLICRDRLVGVITISTEEAGRIFTEQEQHVLRLLATQGAIAIENARLYDAAQREITERKRAEEEIRSLARFPSENPNPILRVNQDGRILYANESSGPLLADWGCAADGLAPPPWRDAVRESVASQSSRLVDAECGDRIYSLFLTPVPDAGYVNLYAQDITERKQAEEALRRSEENFRRSLDDSPLGVRIVTTEGETVYANRAILEIYGYDSIEELRTTPVKKRYTPESYAGFQIRKKTRQRGENLPSEYEISIVRKNGEVRHLQVFRKEVLWNGERQFQTIYQDITERKRVEEALRGSEGRYRNLVESVSDVIYAIDSSSVLVYISPVVKNTLGYEPDELIGRQFLEFVHKGDHDLLMRGFSELREGIVRRSDCRVIGKQGDIKWVRTLPNPIIEEGAFVGARGVLMDITARKQAEAERERLLAELDTKNRELEAFVYTVSHDLKAPLVSLGGFSSVLQKEYYDQLGEEGKHYLERIQANVARMEVLIRNLLELSRIGQVVGPIEEIDVAVLLREIRDELTLRLEEATAEVVVQAPLPTVRAHRGRFRQVFANLIDNAVKFRSTERALHIEVGCRQEGDFYRFDVADNGIGIAPQYHEQIFAPFRKLHPEIEGVGVGLALVKKIVEHHRGRIWVESEAGKGSTFYFTIPRG